MSDACVNIRGNANDADFAAAMENVLGQDIPSIPNTVSRGEHRIFWLGPDEWLVTTGSMSGADLVEKLEAALSGMHVAVNDLSGGNVALTLSGADVNDVLLQGCTLDLNELAVGDCAQTGLGKAGVLLSREGENEYTILVRRSFSGYLTQWLEHAGHAREFEFG